VNYKYVTRGKSILNTAIDLLEEKGIKGMTMKAISKREGVTEPAIYRYYSSKKNVVIAILEEFAKYDEQIMNTIVQQNMGNLKSLRFFCTALADYYQGYPEVVTVMFSLDVFRYDEDTNRKMESIIENRYNFIGSFVDKALQNGEITIDLEKDILVELICGILMNTTSSWKREHCIYNLKERVEKMFDNIFGGYI
jgi:AcrR family transcriptional regulator